jgi:hypothetical protein
MRSGSATMSLKIPIPGRRRFRSSAIGKPMRSSSDKVVATNPAVCSIASRKSREPSTWA